MTFYPVNIERHPEGFIARFPDIPAIDDCIGVGADDAYLNAAERLDWTLVDMYLRGEAQPFASAVKDGQLAIRSRLFWLVGY